MEVLYIMYVDIERNVRGYQVVTLCNGTRKVFGKKYDIYLDASGYGSGAARMLKILEIPHRIVKHEMVNDR